MGASAYENLWEPLLKDKFGNRYEEIALPWFWARVHYRTAALGYLRGGLQQLYDTLMHKLIGLGRKCDWRRRWTKCRPQNLGSESHTVHRRRCSIR